MTDDRTTGLPDGSVDADDPWFHFVYDDSWRIVATYRADHAGAWTIDSDPKERFVYHNAGLDGYGGSSYIDAVILRERDADNTGGWAGSPDGTPEERTYYVQNWRADVVALFTDAGALIQQVRYDPYGVPFGIPKTDVTGDGVVDTQDLLRWVGSDIYNGGAGTHPYADWDLDGDVDSADQTAYTSDRSADTSLGRGALGYDFEHIGGENRRGYGSYEAAIELAGFQSGLYHVRFRTYMSESGRWLSRDPVGYVSASLYGYVDQHVIRSTDPFGLWCWDGVGVRAEKGDTLWELARILFGSGARWPELGYTGDPNKLQEGTWIDLSKWVTRHVLTIEQYERVIRQQNALIDAIAANGGLADWEFIQQVADISAEKAFMANLNSLGWASAIAEDVADGLDKIAGLLETDVIRYGAELDGWREMVRKAGLTRLGAGVAAEGLKAFEVYNLLKAYERGDRGEMTQSLSSLLLGGVVAAARRGAATRWLGGPLTAGASFVISGVAIGIETRSELLKAGYYQRSRAEAQQFRMSQLGRLQALGAANRTAYIRARAFVDLFPPCDNLVGPVGPPDPSLFPRPGGGGGGGEWSAN